MVTVNLLYPYTLAGQHRALCPLCSETFVHMQIQCESGGLVDKENRLVTGKSQVQIPLGASEVPLSKVPYIYTHTDGLKLMASSR